jgi:hypothetical protein
LFEKRQVVALFFCDVCGKQGPELLERGEVG